MARTIQRNLTKDQRPYITKNEKASLRIDIRECTGGGGGEGGRNLEHSLRLYQPETRRWESGDCGPEEGTA